MKKCGLFIVSLFLLTGCSVKYNLIINEDNKVDETVIFSEKDDIIKQYNSNINNGIKDIATFYFSGENNISPEIKIDTTNINNKNNNGTSNYGLSRTFSSISEYGNGLFFNYYFKNSSIELKNNNYTIFGSGFNWDSVKNLSNDYKYKFDVDNITIAIKLPYVVIENNATNINKNENIYYWIFNSDNYKENYIKLVYSNNQKWEKPTEPKNNNIIENLIENISEGSINGQIFMKENKWPIILFIIALVIGVLFLFFRKKINKNDEL